MLILQRSVDQSISIRVSDDVPSEMTVHELFSEKDITITVTECRGGVVKFGVNAPIELDVIRN